MSFRIRSTKTNFSLRFNQLSLPKIQEIIKDHFIAKEDKIAIHGHNSFEKNTREYASWRNLGITRQEPGFKKRRGYLLPQILTIPDMKTAFVNITPVDRINLDQRNRPRYYEIDLAFVDNEGTLHLGEFMSSSTAGEVNRKHRLLNKPVVFEAVRRALNHFLPSTNQIDINHFGDFLFIVPKIPVKNTLNVKPNVIFVTYNGPANKAVINWESIKQKVNEKKRR